MAKQLVNPIERHVEKAVVVVAALILVLVIVRYVVTSPNKMELRDKTVTPRTIDAIVADRANEVLGRLRNAEPAINRPEPLFEAFAGSLAPIEAKPLAPVTPFQPTVPIIDPPIELVGRAKLVAVLVPRAPQLTHGRSTIAMPGTEGSSTQYQPTNWVTVSSLFEFKKQVELQKQAYGATQDELIVFPPEIQKRKARADGSWLDDDWVEVQPWPAPPMPPIPVLSFEESARDKALVLSTADRKRVDDFLKAVQEPLRQREFIRPLMAPVVNGAQWTFPMLTSHMDVRRQDEQFISPDKPQSPNPIDLYGTAPKVTAAPVRELTPEQEMDATLKQAEDLLASARKNKSRAEAVRAFNLAHDVKVSGSANSRQRNQADSIQRQAEQTEKDIIREERIGGHARGPVTAPEAQVRREPQPIQQVWAHDAAVESVKNNFAYQYRMRFRILNQFVGMPEKFDDPNDATKVMLLSDWSSPSDSVAFEPVSLYYVTYDDRSNEEIGVEFFRWYYGVWVKSRRERFQIGDRVMIEQRTSVPFIDDPEQTDNAPVLYSADEQVVDIDFTRRSAERKSSRSANGVGFGPLRDDTAVVLMGPDGSLSERSVSLDRDHPTKRVAASKVWTPRRR